MSSTIKMWTISPARNQAFDVVLVDTAGRMQDNAPLMTALAKLIAVNMPDLVLFVGEALVGNEAVDQLVRQLKYFFFVLFSETETQSPADALERASCYNRARMKRNFYNQHNGLEGKIRSYSPAFKQRSAACSNELLRSYIVISVFLLFHTASLTHSLGEWKAGALHINSLLLSGVSPGEVQPGSGGPLHV